MSIADLAPAPVSARMRRKLTIVIPVFNEVNTVAAVVRRVAAQPIGALEKEIIAVNDGSSDGTREALDALAGEVPGLAVHHFARNRGKGAAVREGFTRSTGDLVIVQDADLELDPAMYPRLLEPILAGRAGVVYGSSDKMAAYPTSHPHDPRDLAATVYHLLGVPADTLVYDQNRRPHALVIGEKIDGLLA